ncbi:MAG: Gfo/Idh/MocA family oxidoreductase [Alphaproteobacteria bacterium]
MNLFITGATGLVGRDLVRAAASGGHAVHVLSRRPAPALDGCLAGLVAKDIRALAAADIPAGTDAVIHLATGNDGDREHQLAVAVDGTLNAFRAAREAGIARFVHVSSMSVYPGRQRPDPRRLDGRALEPAPDRRGVYAETKTVAELALQDAIAGEGAGAMDVTIVRPGLVYAPDMATPLAGVAAIVPGGLAVGLGRRAAGVPYLAIEDLTAGLLALAAQPAVPGRHRLFDILSGKSPRKDAIVALHAGMTGRGRRQVWLPRPLPWSAAMLVEGASRLRGGARHLPYKVNRIYEFDATALDPAPFWQAVGIAPAGRPDLSVRDALTIARHPAPAAGAAAAMRHRASALVAAAGRTPPPGAAEPLVLVGAGRIVEEMHLPAIAAVPGLEVRAVVDSNRAQAERVAAMLGGRAAALGSLAEVPDETLSGGTAVIATPGFTHATLAAEALGRGAAVLLEKPAALRARDFAAIAAAADKQPVTVFHNYRLRPNALALWRFIETHDVGAPVAARVSFHSGRILGEAARWSHAEKANRVLLLELAVHFLDIALHVTGPIEDVLACHVVDGGDRAAIVAAGGTAATRSGARLDFDLSLAGTARRSEIVIEFERAAVSLDFFPEGFRVLPARRDPVDDTLAALSRFAGFVGQRLRPRSGGVPKRALPHAAIYREHLARRRGAEAGSPFALDAVADTMASLYRLADRLYPGD